MKAVIDWLVPDRVYAFWWGWFACGLSILFACAAHKLGLPS